jgi:restriction system protein
MYPPTPKLFVGREEALATLADWLKAPVQGPIVVMGDGGIGKSAFVAHLLEQQYPIQAVAWLSLHRDLGPAQIAEHVRRFEEKKPEVVVLDDVERLSPEALHHLLGRIRATLPETPVIATSRTSVSLLDARTLSLDALSTPEAVALLRNALGPKGDRELSALALRLGNHPLALALASSLARQMAIGELIEQLDNAAYELEEQVSRAPEPTIEIAASHIVLATDGIIERIRRQPNDIHLLSGRQFEELVASLMQDMGWEVHLTQQTRDGGRDILAYLQTEIGRLLCLVEAKRYRPDRPIGVELVRALYGVLSHEQANSAMLVTTSHFTKDAKEFQAKHVYQLALREYQDVMTWIKKYRGHRP